MFEKKYVLEEINRLLENCNKLYRGAMEADDIRGVCEFSMAADVLKILKDNLGLKEE